MRAKVLGNLGMAWGAAVILSLVFTLGYSQGIKTAEREGGEANEVKGQKPPAKSKPERDSANLSSLMMHASSGVRFLLIDSQGRKTGYDPALGKIVEEIPNSSYEKEEPYVNVETGEAPGEGVNLLFANDPESGSYLLEVTTEEKSYEVTVWGYNREAKVDQEIIAGNENFSLFVVNYSQETGQVNAMKLPVELVQLPSLLTPTPVKTNSLQQPPAKPVKTSFTGEELWQAVNKYRKEHGVPELQLKGSLCELSSKRLGEILALGKLDNHAGFEKFFEEHRVSELGVTNVAENLASGYPTAWDTVMGWDSSPGHKTFLLADGSYVWGCASANQGFAVLIGGY